MRSTYTTRDLFAIAKFVVTITLANVNGFAAYTSYVG